MKLIITDCFDSKLTALDGVCREVFGLHNYKIIKNKPSKFLKMPTSPDEMESRIMERVFDLQNYFEREKLDIKIGKDDDVYFSSLEEGFIKNNKCWMIYASAVFRKQHDVWFVGQTEATAIKKELWQFIDLPDEERCRKFKEFDQVLEFQPLIYYTNGTSESDWYKQAFRNCIPICARS